jgi:hypothetical protein
MTSPVVQIRVFDTRESKMLVKTRVSAPPPAALRSDRSLHLRIDGDLISMGFVLHTAVYFVLNFRLERKELLVSPFSQA